MDSETSRGVESDDLPKRGLTEEEFWRLIREELEPVKSALEEAKKDREEAKKDREEAKKDREEAKKDRELIISLLTDKFRSHIADTDKGKKAQQTRSPVKDEDAVQGEASEELEHSSSQSVQPVSREKKDEVRNLQLQFERGPSPVFHTMDKLYIEVKLVDANTGHIVNLGSESAVEVEVVVLEGEFRTFGYDSRTKEAFKNSVVKPRRDKGSLLVGTVKVHLNGGIGVLNHLWFADNSSWTRSKKFRLGLQTVADYREIIREAITDPFRVLEQRGRSKRQRDKPAPDDGGLGLKNIRRNETLHKKRSEAGIGYVGQPPMNSDELKGMMKEGKWDELRERAETRHLNGDPHVSLDSESDHQNGCQHTDLKAEQVHRADDKFSLKQKNHENTFGKASSSFSSRVFEQQTENPAPAQHNMAPSTCAAPVVVEAPLAYAGSTAEGHNDVTGLPSTTQSQDTMKDPANEALPPRQPTRVHSLSALLARRDDATVDQFHDFNWQATMPSHVSSSSSQMGNTSNQNGVPTSEGLPQFLDDNSEDDMRWQKFDSSWQECSPLNVLNAYYALPPEGENVMVDSSSNVADDGTNFADQQNIEVPFHTSLWGCSDR